MADIISAISKVNTNEVQQGKPTSEALFSKLGANVNALIDSAVSGAVFTADGNWLCPEGVTNIFIAAVGGGAGGGGGGGDSAGFAGSVGQPTNFNGNLVAQGGNGGEGGWEVGPLGRGRDGGQSGQIEGLGGQLGGAGAAGTYFGGAAYGAGGGGGRGDWALGGGGAGGGGGRIGFGVFAVTPGVSYPIDIGAGGAGGAYGSTGSVGNKTAGSAGSAGALIIVYASK